MMRLLVVVTSFCFVILSIARGDFVVVVDAGHGGTAVPGKSDSTQEGDGASWNNARSASGKHLEKDLTLSYALAIKRAFEADPRARELKIKTVLTRETDIHLSAMERAAVAVRESADVVLSIHFNAANGKAEGTRAYYCAADHPKWEFMHFTNPYEARDRKFSELVCKHVANAFQPFGGKPEKRVTGDDARDRKDGLRLLGFIRQDTHMRNAAAALLEVEFIDNPTVEAWLLSEANKARAEEAAAKGVVAAICAWLSLPPTERDFVPKARKAPGR